MSAKPAATSVISIFAKITNHPSALCSSSGWSLQVEDGEQRELTYWSSDWSYRCPDIKFLMVGAIFFLILNSHAFLKRNDADLVGVKGGLCQIASFGLNFEIR